MEQTIYERPREKLQARGAAALSVAELLQVIIGSGSAGMPVARIARKVAEAIATNQALDINKLLLLPGLGEANACRIIAAVQLGALLAHPTSPLFRLDTQLLAIYKKPHILIGTLTGSHQPIKTYINALKLPFNSVAVARQVSAKAISDNAEAVAVAIGYKNQSREPTIAELSLLEDLKKMTQLLHIYIYSFELVSTTGTTVLVGKRV